MPGGGKVSQDKRDSFPPVKVTEMLNRCELAVLQSAVADTAEGAAQTDEERANGVLAGAMKRSEIDTDGLAWLVVSRST